MKKSTLKSVTRLLFVTTQYAALLWVSISYLIALYATVRLGQVFPDLVGQLHPGVFFVINDRNAHGRFLLLQTYSASVSRGGDSGMEKDTVEPVSELSIWKSHWLP